MLMHVKQTPCFLQRDYGLVSSAQRVDVPDEQPQRLLGLHCSVQWPLGRLCLRCSHELGGAISSRWGGVMRMVRMAHVGQHAFGLPLPNLAPQVFRNTACVRWHAAL